MAACDSPSAIAAGQHETHGISRSIAHQTGMFHCGPCGRIYLPGHMCHQSDSAYILKIVLLTKCSDLPTRNSYKVSIPQSQQHLNAICMGRICANLYIVWNAEIVPVKRAGEVRRSSQGNRLGQQAFLFLTHCKRGEGQVLEQRKRVFTS